MVRRNLNRQKIIDAAATVLDRDGMEQLTLQKVSKALQVKPPSLFNHISGLPEIKSELTVLGVNQLMEYLTESVDPHSEENLWYQIACGYRKFAHRHPGLYDAITNAPDELSEKALEEINSPFLWVVKNLGIKDMKFEDQVHTVRIIRSMLHGFIDLEKSGGFKQKVDPDVSFKKMVDVFIEQFKNFS